MTYHNYSIPDVTADAILLSRQYDAPVDLLAAELWAPGRQVVGRVHGQSAPAELAVG